MEYKQTGRGDLIVGSKVTDGVAKCRCLFRINSFMCGKISLSLIKRDLSCIEESHKMNDNNYFISVREESLIIIKDIYCI